MLVKTRLLVPALALLALAGCGTQAASTSSPATTTTTTTAAATAAQTCKQQAAQWKTSNAAHIASFKAALTPFSTGGTVTSAQAKALSSSAQALQDSPIPACSDPKGYYSTAMANLVTAGAAASGGGALSELGALAPMENASTALTELSGELTQTIGSSKL